MTVDTNVTVMTINTNVAVMTITSTLIVSTINTDNTVMTVNNATFLCEVAPRRLQLLLSPPDFLLIFSKN